MTDVRKGEPQVSLGGLNRERKGIISKLAVSVETAEPLTERP